MKVDDMTNDYITSVPREEQERRGKIRTFTGKYVNPFAMRAADLDIRDIAHSLSIIKRYTGHTPVGYSVAQHSVWVSRQFADRELALAGLLHDAAEAYLNDLASPVKHSPALAGYVAGMERLERLLFATFGLDWKLMAAVKPADNAAFKLEVKSFWEPNTLSPFERIRPHYSDRFSEQQFLARYRSLDGHSLFERPILDIHRPMEAVS